MRFFDIPYLKSSDAMFASRQKNILRRNTRSFSPVNLESVTAQMAPYCYCFTKGFLASIMKIFKAIGNSRYSAPYPKSLGTYLSFTHYSCNLLNLKTLV